MRENPFVAACGCVASAVFPFVTLGFLGNRVVSYVSVIVGVVAISGMGYGLLFKDKCASWMQHCNMTLRDLMFPYAFALSALILEQNGIDATLGLWFAIALAATVIIASLFPRK